MTNDLLPKDLTSAVMDLKFAILQARNRAARASNAEALKLYFFVGGYISKKTRNAKWGSGAIDALSERLQVELPGLRGVSAMSIRYMRLFFEAWAPSHEIQHLPSVENDELRNRQFSSDSIRPMSMGELELVPIGYVEEGEIRSLPTNELWLAENAAEIKADK